MKDKTAATRKKKRKEAKTKELEAAKSNFLNIFNEQLREKGVEKRYKKERVWQAHIKLKKELQRTSHVYCLYTTMVCLHELYGWSAIRIERYCLWILQISKILIEGHRTLEQLNEELQDEVGLDIPQMFESKVMQFNSNTSERQTRADAVLAEMTNDMILCMYPIYFFAGFKQKRMTRLSTMVRSKVEKALINEDIDTIKASLRKCGIEATDEGVRVIKPRREV